MKKYQVALFDWDGCLAQTLQIVLDTYKKTFAEYNLFPSNQKIISEALGNWKGPLNFGIKDAETFTQKFLLSLYPAYSQAKLYPEAKNTLIRLKDEGIKIGILTTSTLQAIEPVISKYELRDYIDLLLTAENVVNHKPHPEIIQKALKTLKIDKSKAVIIGDSKSDLGAAQNASIDSILFYPKQNEAFHDLEKLREYNPTYIATDFNEVIRILT